MCYKRHEDSSCCLRTTSVISGVLPPVISTYTIPEQMRASTLDMLTLLCGLS